MIVLAAWAATAAQPLLGVVALVVGVQVGSGTAATPQTPLGREIETLLLALRPALVLVPVGIVVAVVRRTRRERRAPAPRPAGACDACGLTEHASDAAYCRRCGEWLVPTAGGTPR